MGCMRTVGRVLVALLLARPAAAQNGIRVHRYEFNITISATDSSIAGRALIQLHGPPGPRDTMGLNLVAMQVDAVTSLGSQLVYTYDGRILRIPLDRARSLMDNWLVEVTYHGAPQDGLVIGANARGRRSAFADNWPERARYWLPTIDRPSQKATVSFKVDVPAGWRVVANGTLVAPGRSTDGQTTWWWAEDRWIPTYTMVIGAGEFTVSTHRPVVNGGDSIPIQVWAYAEDSAFAD